MFCCLLSVRLFSSNTARLYVASISFQCKIQSKEDITGHFLVTKVMEGFNRSAKKEGLRLPITIDILRGILTKLPVVCQDGFETSLFSAAYIMAFFGFFRVGELTVAKRGDLSIEKVLGINDICWIEKNQSLLVTLSFLKLINMGKELVLEWFEQARICVLSHGWNITCLLGQKSLVHYSAILMVIH